MTYPDALAGLMRTADECGLAVQIERPASDEARAELLPVLGPSLLAEIDAHGYPGGLEIPWTAEELFVYPLGEMAARQAGYRFDARTLEPSPFWNPRKHVLADVRADPIVLEPDSPLWAAVHGVGGWTWRKVARDLPEFLATLDAWLRFFVLERDREIFDDDFNLLDEAREAILSRVLAPLDAECRAGFAEVLLEL